MGDALVELGECDRAFEAFDTMVAMRPHAAAYARVKSGRVAEGLAASARALRTGTRDARIVSHAAEIRAARRVPAEGVSAFADRSAEAFALR